MASTRWLTPPGAGYASDSVPARYDRAQQAWVVFVGNAWVPVPPDIDIRGLAANGDVYEVKQAPDGDFDYGSELQQAPAQPAPTSPISGAAGLAGGTGTPPAQPPPPSGPVAAAGSVAGGTGQPAPASGVFGAGQGVAGGAAAHRPGAAPGGAEGPQVGTAPAAFRPGAAPGGAEGPVTDPNQPGGARYNAMLQANMTAARQAPAPGTPPVAMPSAAPPPMPGPNLGYTNAAKAAGEQRTAQSDAAAANAQPAAPAAPAGPNLAEMGWKWDEASNRWYDPNAQPKPAAPPDRFSDVSGGSVQGGTQDRMRGYAQGGVHMMPDGAMMANSEMSGGPPMPGQGGGGKAIMGEGPMKDGPGGNGYRAELVISPEAIRQGLVRMVDGPTETEPEVGTMIIPLPRNLQGLANSLPPMPGRPARFAQGGYVIGGPPQYKTGGTYGPAPMPGGGSPAPTPDQPTPSVWDYFGGKPPLPTSGNRLAMYSPSQRGLLDQEMAAAGSGLNSNDLTFLFRNVGPGVGSRDGVWS